MVEPLRHRQTKGAATDMFYLMLPRHISTLPFAFSAGVMMSATIPSGTVAITAKLRHHLFEDAALPTNTHRSQTAMSST